MYRQDRRSPILLSWERREDSSQRIYDCIYTNKPVRADLSKPNKEGKQYVNHS